MKLVSKAEETIEKDELVAHQQEDWQMDREQVVAEKMNGLLTLADWVQEERIKNINSAKQKEEEKTAQRERALVEELRQLDQERKTAAAEQKRIYAINVAVEKQRIEQKRIYKFSKCSCTRKN